jgi:hypothetical protein
MRSLKLGFMIVGGLLIPLACGGTDRANDSGSQAGAAGGAPPEVEAAAGASGEGSGMLEVPAPVLCGIQICQAIVLGGTAVAPCCVEPRGGICGADVSTLVPGMGCQPLTQAGRLDPACPSSMGSNSGLPLPPAPGCCREATGQCGYWVGNLGGLLPFAPGCLDPSALGGVDAPRACGGGEEAGSGGRSSGGAGGESSVSGGAATAGGAAAGGVAAAGAPADDSTLGGQGGREAAPVP